MRAHSIRRSLWFANLGIGLAAAAAIAWFVLEVRPAVGNPAYVKPAWAEDVVRAVEEQPAVGSAIPTRRISKEEVEEIDRPAFKDSRGQRYHWLYSGSMPPPPPAEPEAVEERAPVIDDLSRLGRVRMLIYTPPEEPGGVASETLLLWEFVTGGTRRTFKPGEAIRERDPDREPAQRSGIWFVDVKPKEAGVPVWEIHYRVYDGDREPRDGVFVYDARPSPDPRLAGVIQTTAAGAAGASGEGAAGASGAGTGTISSTPGVAAGTADAPSDVVPDLSELRPILDPDPETGGYKVRFDEKTFDYFRNASADTIASTVQTTPIEQDGRVIGLQITGISEGSPADRFDIQRGDVLVSINDQPVATRSDALGIVQRLPEETERVKVVIDRRGRQIVYNIDPRDPRVRREGRYLDPGEQPDDR